MQDSQQIAERGDSHSLLSELEDVVTVKTSEPLKVGKLCTHVLN